MPSAKQFTTRSRVAALFLGIAMLFVSACGGSSSGGSGDEAEITTLVEDFFDATVKGNGDKGYALLSAESKSNCTEAEFKEQAESTAEFFEALGTKVELKRVHDIKVDGDNATAKIEVLVDGEAGDSADEPVPFVKEGGKWKILEGC